VVNQTRFVALAQAFGGDIDRWPVAARAEAGRWLETHPQAEAVLAGERAVDAGLGAFVVAPPSADLQRRIATRLLCERRGSRGLPRGLPGALAGWLSALAALIGVGAIAAGATAGAAVIAASPPQPHGERFGAIYEQSSFGDLGAVDDGGREKPDA
jgi:ferric-dicitrate binding protein FerR (iron transport regulator)